LPFHHWEPCIGFSTKGRHSASLKWEMQRTLLALSLHWYFQTTHHIGGLKGSNLDVPLFSRDVPRDLRRLSKSPSSSSSSSFDESFLTHARSGDSLGYIWDGRSS
jgi:hypothetical protein